MVSKSSEEKKEKQLEKNHQQQKDNDYIKSLLQHIFQSCVAFFLTCYFSVLHFIPSESQLYCDGV